MCVLVVVVVIEKWHTMEVPLLHSDAVQWTVVRVPAAVAPAAAPCCPRAGDVGGGTTPSGALRANTVVWCVSFLFGVLVSLLSCSGEWFFMVI